MPTAITEQVGQQLSRAYEQTQRELAKDPEMIVRVWEEQLTRLQEVDLSSATFPEFIQAHAAVSILEQSLVAVAGRAGYFNGNQRVQ